MSDKEGKTLTIVGGIYDIPVGYYVDGEFFDQHEPTGNESWTWYRLVLAPFDIETVRSVCLNKESTEAMEWDGKFKASYPDQLSTLREAGGFRSFSTFQFEDLA